MSQYNKTVLTNAGLELAKRANAGQAKFKITRAVTSADDWSNKTIQDLEEATAIPNIMQQGTIMDAEEVESNNSVIGVSLCFTNKDLSTSYQIRVIGLYVKEEGQDKDFLYAVTTAVTPEYMPDFNDKVMYRFNMQIYLVIGKAQAVNVVINDGASVTHGQFDKYKSEVTADLEKIENTHKEDMSHVVKSASINDGDEILPDEAGKLKLVVPDPDLSKYVSLEQLTETLKTKADITAIPDKTATEEGIKQAKAAAKAADDKAQSALVQLPNKADTSTVNAQIADAKNTIKSNVANLQNAISNGLAGKADKSQVNVDGPLFKDLTQFNNWSDLFDSYSVQGISATNASRLVAFRDDTNGINTVGSNGAGIAFGGGDTKGVLSVSYGDHMARIAGGNGTSPRWHEDIAWKSDINSLQSTVNGKADKTDVASLQNTVNNIDSTRTPIVAGTSGDDLFAFKTNQIRLYNGNGSTCKNLPPAENINWFSVQYVFEGPNNNGIAIYRTPSNEIWTVGCNGGSYTLNLGKGWLRVANSNDISNLQNQVDSKTSGTIVTAYDIASKTPIKETNSYTTKWLVDQLALSPFADQINQLKGRRTADAPDFNTLTDSGVYFISNTNSGRNSPPIPYWGTLAVFNGGNNQRIMQIFSADDGTSVFTRIYGISGAAVWGSWNQIAWKSDINSLQSTINQQNQTIQSLITRLNNAENEIKYIKDNYIEGKRFPASQEAQAEAWENEKPTRLAMIEK